LLLAGGALLLAGCGLSDYLGQQSSEASRLQRWDEENKLLGDPLAMPEFPKKDGKAQTWDVFLRPPSGVGVSPTLQQNGKEPDLKGGLLAQYSGFGSVQMVYLGVGTDPKDKDYVSNALGALGGTAEGLQVIPPIKGPKRDISLRREVIADEKSKTKVFVYVYDNNPHTVIVAYRVVQGKEDEVARANGAIEMSLSTLAEGGTEAATSRLEFDKTHRKKK
jgi:hypothetical protein